MLFRKDKRLIYTVHVTTTAQHEHNKRLEYERDYIVYAMDDDEAIRKVRRLTREVNESWKLDFDNVITEVEEQ